MRVGGVIPWICVDAGISLDIVEESDQMGHEYRQRDCARNIKHDAVQTLQRVNTALNHDTRHKKWVGQGIFISIKIRSSMMLTGNI